MRFRGLQGVFPEAAGVGRPRPIAIERELLGRLSLARQGVGRLDSLDLIR